MDGGSIPPTSTWETNMRFFLEVTKSFWQQLVEDTIKRGVATLVTEGVKGGVEIYKEVYRSKKTKKEEPPTPATAPPEPVAEKKCSKCKCKKE